MTVEYFSFQKRASPNAKMEYYGDCISISEDG